MDLVSCGRSLGKKFVVFGSLVSDYNTIPLALQVDTLFLRKINILVHNVRQLKSGQLNLKDGTSHILILKKGKGKTFQNIYS